MIINSFLSFLQERQGNCKRVYAFNTFFYPRLIADNGDVRVAFNASIRRWTQHIDLFSYDIAFIPIHCHGNHWALMCVNLESKSLTYYDSLASPFVNSKGQAEMSRVLEYLKLEFVDKGNGPFLPTECSIGTLGITVDVETDQGKVPQQENGNDCGVFVCKIAESISQQLPLMFDQSDVTSYRTPPHRLFLKVGAIVILLRNLNPNCGLCNGT